MRASNQPRLNVERRAESAGSADGCVVRAAIFSRDWGSCGLIRHAPYLHPSPVGGMVRVNDL